MTLTAGRGPLSADPAGWFSPPLPDGAVYAEPHPRRVVAVRAGRTVLDTEDVVMVHRRGHPLSYAFRPDAVADLPHEPAAEAPGYVYVPWDAVDTWFEEGRELVHYPPNPYHRVDCRPTERGLRVTVAGTVLVDTRRTVAVFETALAPVLYVDPAHVRVDALRPSATTSYCNYKGWATYWSAVVDGAVVEDLAWSYAEPFAECAVIAGFFSFDATRAEVRAELPVSPV
ncbi:DUF427 domain-containing protein [Mycolicibacterium litorale]|uniref:DUF427 domain-containing protein n=1 Tax=Mycolicibacterium litorale TaxID=758802 RepID=A0AAD1ILI7_9MYCO|nr:DUF427 domain-containing protein [Mycolicibacterium litorale]MCV7415448.1 DUF427 domain-containing protein [Mycolicibacterium litorale]TDY08703.1 uncharacterized protein (DUF427 family) [Mycolicibacterium litorale]BBY16628.1 hypothetical protein MLIT_22200 [Mycolicibacterium litorale]